MTPIKSLFVVACLTGMGMFLVWQRAEARRIGYEAASLQRRALQLEEENRRLFTEVCALKSPQFIAHKVQSMGLGLSEPDVVSSSAAIVSEAKPDKTETPAPLMAASPTRKESPRETLIQ